MGWSSSPPCHTQQPSRHPNQPRPPQTCAGTSWTSPRTRGGHTCSRGLMINIHKGAARPMQTATGRLRHLLPAHAGHIRVHRGGILVGWMHQVKPHTLVVTSQAALHYGHLHRQRAEGSRYTPPPKPARQHQGATGGCMRLLAPSWRVLCQPHGRDTGTHMCVHTPLSATTTWGNTVDTPNCYGTINAWSAMVDQTSIGCCQP